LGLGKLLVGKVSHYFNKAGVAVVDLTGDLKVGDRISFEGAHTNFQQTVASMQVEHKNISSAKAGQSIGLKTNDRVHEHDAVYKIVD